MFGDEQGGNMHWRIGTREMVCPYFLRENYCTELDASGSVDYDIPVPYISRFHPIHKRAARARYGYVSSLSFGEIRTTPAVGLVVPGQMC